MGNGKEAAQKHTKAIRFIALALRLRKQALTRFLKGEPSKEYAVSLSSLEAKDCWGPLSTAIVYQHDPVGQSLNEKTS